jgi:hypothetical protein
MPFLDALVDEPALEVENPTFGILPELLGPSFPAREIIQSVRRAELAYRTNFFKCKQHDWKAYDWNGALRPVRRFPTQPLIGGSMPDTYIPLDQRRPRSPYRLAKTIVNSFTNLLFGHGCWPTITSEDPVTQDFVEALVKACKLKTKMIRARNLGGSCGTVGISWGFRDGNPVVRTHSAEHLYVLEWADEDEFIPAHVVELYQYPKDQYNHKKRQYERVLYWHRRDWTLDADVEFEPTPVQDENPSWVIDAKSSVSHNHGVCHFVWVQNNPNDDVNSIDGLPDYDELYEQLDSIDIVNSVNVKGIISNLDPTLKLKMDQEEVAGAIIQKGSDNAIVTGQSGDATYLEISGAAVIAGNNAIKAQRDQVLEAASCIVPNANEVAAGSVSSVALKVVYSPMLSRGDIMRDQYGEAIIRVLQGMVDYARMLSVGETVEEIEVDETGTQMSTNLVQSTLNLPPRIEKIELVDEIGNPTGEYEIQLHDRVPGTGSLALEWPSYFEETPDDLNKTVTSLNVATGGKASISQRTAVETVCKIIKRSPIEEFARLKEQEQKDKDAMSGMFPPTGGQVDDMNALPPGAEELDNADQQEEGPAGSTEERPE